MANHLECYGYRLIQIWHIILHAMANRMLDDNRSMSDDNPSKERWEDDIEKTKNNILLSFLIY